jgi:F-type H+-transporting ATPase subunit epsilon
MGKHATLVDVGLPQRILHVSVVTPEATLLETPAQFVALPLFDGELGVLPGRSPFIGRLGYGELRVVEGD